jgi:cysteine desulfurase
MIYLDNHATTPCDPRVAERMMPWLVEKFGNPHSTSHAFGREANAAIEASLELMATRLGVAADAIVMTSGATESINLAIDGICRHPRQKKRHVVTTTIEHHAVLDVVARLEKDGFRVSRVGVHRSGHESAGQID